jgi:anaerobic magnesium-protoporphyrin IX monomethyl ester cyclase
MGDRMNVIVVNSPLFRDKNTLYDEDSLPPIGLGIIATGLRNAGFEVELIDAVALNISLEDLIAKIAAINPMYVCTNIFTTNYQLVKELILSDTLSSSFIVGGLSTKGLYNEIFEWETDKNISVVHGDGEKIVLDIVLDRLKEKSSASQGNKSFYSVDSASVYYVTDISKETLDRSFFLNEPTIHPLGFTEANIVTSRGCIYNCTFCAAARSVNTQLGIREKSTASITSEIEHLVNIYPGLQSIRVLDDLFLKNHKTIEKAIEVFGQFELQWRAMAHVETFRNVTNEMVLALKQTGCKELFIGIESGSTRILRGINKTSDIDKIKGSITLLLKNGINVKGYFIFGFPGETEEDFEMTYTLALYLKNESLKYGTVFRPSVFQYRPYHGTALYHTLEKYEKSDVHNIISTEPNRELSELVGRLQFNFHSGNFSDAPIQAVHDYILKTSNLNSLSIFGLDGKIKRTPQ